MINEARMLEEFFELVRMDCPSGQEKAVAEVLRRKLEALGCTVSEDQAQQHFEGNCGNLIATLPATKASAPTVLFTSHMDCVSPCLSIQPRLENGRITSAGDTVLGGDAFYYRKLNGNFDRLISVGNVIIENNVEIGNGCTIDRGVTDSTTIGEGSVLDNQIQIGHDTIIGKKVLIASQTGIAGCCIIEDEVTIWGQVGMASGVRVEKGTVLLAKCGVNRDLKKGTYFGSLADEFRDYLRKEVVIKNMIKRKS